VSTPTEIHAALAHADEVAKLGALAGDWIHLVRLAAHVRAVHAEMQRMEASLKTTPLLSRFEETVERKAGDRAYRDAASLLLPNPVSK
jgi:hypothetical protein